MKDNMPFGSMRFDSDANVRISTNGLWHFELPDANAQRIGTKIVVQIKEPCVVQWKSLDGGIVTLKDNGVSCEFEIVEVEGTPKSHKHWLGPFPVKER